MTDCSGTHHAATQTDWSLPETTKSHTEDAYRSTNNFDGGACNDGTHASGSRTAHRFLSQQQAYHLPTSQFEDASYLSALSRATELISHPSFSALDSNLYGNAGQMLSPLSTETCLDCNDPCTVFCHGADTTCTEPGYCDSPQCEEQLCDNINCTIPDCTDSNCCANACCTPPCYDQNCDLDEQCPLGTDLDQCCNLADLDCSFDGTPLNGQSGGLLCHPQHNWNSNLWNGQCFGPEQFEGLDLCNLGAHIGPKCDGTIHGSQQNICGSFGQNQIHRNGLQSSTGHIHQSHLQFCGFPNGHEHPQTCQHSHSNFPAQISNNLNCRHFGALDSFNTSHASSSNNLQSPSTPLLQYSSPSIFSGTSPPQYHSALTSTLRTTAQGAITKSIKKRQDSRSFSLSSLASLAADAWTATSNSSPVPDTPMTILTAPTQSPTTIAESTTAATQQQIEEPLTCQWVLKPSSSPNEDHQTCALTFPNPSALQSHIETAHIKPLPKNSFHCAWSTCPLFLAALTANEPPKSHAQRGKLARHVLTHTKCAKHACLYCDFTAKTKEQLENHLRTHDGRKPYVCEICGKRSGTQTAARTHERVHTGEKRFWCRFEGCGFGTGDSSNLSKHEKRHRKNGDRLKAECEEHSAKGE